MSELFTTARRTTAAPGMAEEYARAHSRIPDAAADELRDAGVVIWEIWRDGDRIMHRIQSTRPYAEIIAELRSRPSAVPEWNALIASLLSSQPGSDVILTPVWGMDADGQWADR